MSFKDQNDLQLLNMKLEGFLRYCFDIDVAIGIAFNILFSD